nr:hypothetical protein [Candidatus Freyarchaeota archaeon]
MPVQPKRIASLSRLKKLREGRRNKIRKINQKHQPYSIPEPQNTPTRIHTISDIYTSFKDFFVKKLKGEERWIEKLS